MLIDTTDIADQLATAQAALAKLDAALEANEARHARLSQENGERLALQAELSERICEAYTTANSPASRNDQAESALAMYHQLVTEAQSLIGAQPTESLPGLAKRLAYQRQVRDSLAARIAELEARQSAPVEPGTTEFRACLERLRERVR
jgi:hypothetical protein